MSDKQGYGSLKKRIGNRLFKAAQAAADDTQFEQDFSRIAFSFIQDRAPGLMKYLLGFETVDRDEDGSRAVGIFGFKVGKDYYYVPAFFLNNQVKGVDMVLNKRTNTFIPLSEEWVDEITRRQHVELGTAAPDGVENDFEDPDFDFLQHPALVSGGVKTSEAEPVVWSLAYAWERMKDATKEAAVHDAAFGEAWEGFVRAVTKKPSEKRAESADLVRDYISKVGGPRALLSTLDALEGSFKYASAAMSFYKGPDAFMQMDYAPDCYVLRKSADERKIRFTSFPKDEEQARDVVEDGFTVIDRRDDAEKSVGYTMDFVKSMSTPDKAGTYKVLMPGGEFKRGFVLTAESVSGDDQPGDACACESYGSGYHPRRNVLVYFPDDQRRTYDRPIDEIFVNGGPDIESPYDQAKEIGDLEKYDCVLLVGPENTFIGPVDVGPFEGGKDSRPAFSAGVHHSGCWGLTKIELADFCGRPRQRGAVLTIPDDWRFLRLYKRPKKQDNQSWEEYDREVADEIATVGSGADLYETLVKSAHHTLRVRHSGSGGTGSFGLELDDHAMAGPFSYKQASVELVARLGLGYGQAKQMLKSAERTGSGSYIVKFPKTAQFVGVDMPQPGMPSPTTDPYTGMPVYPMQYADETQGQLTGVPEGQYENIPGENVGGELSQQQQEGLPLDQEAQMLAQQAAELGQKTVFDQATIGGLSKVYDTGAVIDTYIPQFMESLDRLGRILFLYYWKHDDFISRYGTEDVVEMEDLLRSTFKTMGKLTIELKRKGLAGDGSDNSVA